MRSLILIVILQLTVLLIKTNGQYQFGDIISFRRLKRLAPRREGFYKHYAVYVGDRYFPDKRPEHNIFEFTGTVGEWIKGLFTTKNSPIANCIFSKLDTKSDHSRDNYLDNVQGFSAGSERQITERIKDKYRSCGRYRPKRNNCEHLATYVRYGVRISLQHGARLEGKAINAPGINTKEILERIGQSDDPVCPIDPGTSAGASAGASASASASGIQCFSNSVCRFVPRST